MMDRNKLEKICDELQRNAERRCNREVELSRKYCDGYNQGCEDIFKYARQEMMREPEVIGVLTQEEIECFKSYIEGLKCREMDIIWGNSDWCEIYKKIVNNPISMKEG